MEISNFPLFSELLHEHLDSRRLGEQITGPDIDAALSRIIKMGDIYLDRPSVDFRSGKDDEYRDITYHIAKKHELNVKSSLRTMVIGEIEKRLMLIAEDSTQNRGGAYLGFRLFIQYLYTHLITRTWDEVHTDPVWVFTSEYIPATKINFSKVSLIFNETVKRSIESDEISEKLDVDEFCQTLLKSILYLIFEQISTDKVLTTSHLKTAINKFNSQYLYHFSGNNWMDLLEQHVKNSLPALFGEYVIWRTLYLNSEYIIRKIDRILSSEYPETDVESADWFRWDAKLTRKDWQDRPDLDEYFFYIFTKIESEKLMAKSPLFSNFAFCQTVEANYLKSLVAHRDRSSFSEFDSDKIGYVERIELSIGSDTTDIVDLAFITRVYNKSNRHFSAPKRAIISETTDKSVTSIEHLLTMEVA